MNALASLISPGKVAPGYRPVCGQCGRYVDSLAVVEGEPGKSEIARVLAKHHGQEHLHTIDFGTRHWEWQDLPRYIAAVDWFQQPEDLTA